jgi:hypothetical protein
MSKPSAASFFPFVIPAKAGIQGRKTRRLPWIPAFAGMTERRDHPLASLGRP